jgi:hypothetical protein
MAGVEAAATDFDEATFEAQLHRAALGVGMTTHSNGPAGRNGRCDSNGPSTRPAVEC